MGRGSNGVVNVQGKKGGKKAPQNWKEAMDASPEARMEFMLAHIDTKYGDFQPDTQAALLFDALSDAERDEMLRRKQFSGMVEGDSFYGDGGMMSTAVSMDRKWMWGQIDTYTWDNEPDDDYGFYIGYKDGSVVNTRDYGEKHKFKRSDAAWAVGTGLMGGYYWTTKEGKGDMMKFNGFTEWKLGKKITT
jgi:hypothetical protein